MLSYFSEFLPRINSLSLILEFSGSQDLKSLQLSSPDQLVLELDNGEREEIRLASRLKNLDYKLLSSERTDNGTTVLAMKLVAEPLNNSREKFSLLMTDSVIWNRADFSLHNSYNLKCSHCNRILINGDDVKSLHDLPSDSWAEMMDLWHCHKPSSDVKDKFKLKFDGLRPSENSIIIGTYFLLLNKGDFGLDLRCHCGKVLGVDDKNNTMKIFKWNLLLNDTTTYHPFYHAYNVILDNINLNASRFYRFVDEETESKTLVVWVFNFGLQISSSHTDKIHDNCFKVMYYEGADDTFDKVEVPRIVLDDLIHQLDMINERIPIGFKKMQQWNVSYLYI